MSLRLFYGRDRGGPVASASGGAEGPRRRSVGSRLSAVLGQGLLDHKEELEKRLRTGDVPRGPSGIHGVPLPPPPWATGDAAGDAAFVHTRMPVILNPGDYDTWQNGAPEDAKALCTAWAGDLTINRTDEQWFRKSAQS